MQTRFVLSLVAMACASSGSAMADRPDFGRPGPGWNQGPGDRRPPPANWQPIYRFYGSNHFLTLTYNEGVGARMNYEGIAFYALSAPQYGTRALYRCLVPGSGDHFVSPDAGCEGRNQEGAYGFVYTNPVRGADLPIYRCYRNGDHLATTNPGECAAAGYNVESVLGYTVRN